jgi:hypothetical protein
VKEVLGAPELALKLYQHGQLLVEALLLEPRLPPADRALLAGYDSGFQQRIDELDRALRPVAPDPETLAAAVAAAVEKDAEQGSSGGSTAPRSASPRPAPGSPQSAGHGSGSGSGGAAAQGSTALADSLAVPPPGSEDPDGLCVPPPLAAMLRPRGLASPHRHGALRDLATNGGGHETLGGAHGDGGAAGFLGGSLGDFGDGDAAFM